jgi:hypothetical protein
LHVLVGWAFAGSTWPCQVTLVVPGVPSTVRDVLPGVEAPTLSAPSAQAVPIRARTKARRARPGALRSELVRIVVSPPKVTFCDTRYKT